MGTKRHKDILKHLRLDLGLVAIAVPVLTFLSLFWPTFLGFLSVSSNTGQPLIGAGFTQRQSEWFWEGVYVCFSWHTAALYVAFIIYLAVLSFDKSPKHVQQKNRGSSIFKAFCAIVGFNLPSALALRSSFLFPLLREGPSWVPERNFGEAYILFVTNFIGPNWLAMGLGFLLGSFVGRIKVISNRSTSFYFYFFTILLGLTIGSFQIAKTF